jgi:hypothetical protein
MQSGLSRLAAGARWAGPDRRFGRFAALWAALLLGQALSGCAGGGQIASLSEARHASVAFESLDGPPPPVFQKFMKSLKDEAGARQIAVVGPNEANYRVRGYLAAHDAGSHTAISWVLDAYDAGQHRVFRLSGEESASGRMWAAADDAVIARIARASMDQFAALAAAAPAPSAAAAAAAPAPQGPSTALGWADDWAPESAGIFRILRREPSRPAEIAADAGSSLPAGEVPMPRSRPPGDAGSSFAFAPEDR